MEPSTPSVAHFIALYRVPDGWMLGEVDGPDFVQFGPLPSKPSPRQLAQDMFPELPHYELGRYDAALNFTDVLRLRTQSQPSE